MAKLSALGKTNDEIMTFLQPIAIDLHMTGNPYANYNYYLSSVMVPGIIMLFIFLITPYSIGTELKFNRAKDWMRMANNNPYLAIAGKMLPQTLIFLSIFLLFEFYIYYVLQFPHPGGAQSAAFILPGGGHKKIKGTAHTECFLMAVPLIMIFHMLILFWRMTHSILSDVVRTVSFSSLLLSLNFSRCPQRCR